MKHLTSRLKRAGKKAGFTLVELIVVIAVLAILAGTGTVAYAGYVKKANMAVDQQMMSDVKYSLQLALADPAAACKGGVGVVLSTGAVAQVKSIDNDADDVAFVESALVDAFGSDWANVLKLKYTGWEGNAAVNAGKYVGSSYDGNEEALLGQIGKLSTNLKDFLGNASLGGSGFEEYLNKLGIDPNASDKTAAANAAVLYVAQTASAANAENVVAALASTSPDLSALMEELGTFGSAAAMYAYAEAYCQYYDKNFQRDADKNLENGQTLLEKFESYPVTDLSSVYAAFNMVSSYAGGRGGEKYADYAAGAGKTDVEAFLGAMSAVKDSESAFLDKLDQDTCYTDGDAASMLKGYMTAGKIGSNAGQTVVVVTKTSQGFGVETYPDLGYGK